jgi:dTDP-4-amino-4,6-dideoxygalactose transaminase
MMIKYLDLKKVNESYGTALTDAVNRVAHSGHYLNGPEVERFEKNFAEYCGCKYCISCANGTEALTLIFMAMEQLGILEDPMEPEYDGMLSVVMPNFTCHATLNGLLRTMQYPTLMDVHADSCCLSTDWLDECFDDNQKAILPVHMFGRCADMDEIRSAAEDYDDLYIVEDCAQAHGATFRGKRAGSMGLAGAYSFYPTKNLGALGDGGAVVTNNKEFAKLVRQLANYGCRKKSIQECVGLNSRMDELQAAVLNAKLPRLDSDNERRRQIAACYREQITNPAVRLLPAADSRYEEVHHIFPIFSTKRNALQKHLAECGVETLIHYPKALNQQKAFKEHYFADRELPVSQKISREELSLPISPVMTDEEVEAVVRAVNLFEPKL